MWALSMLSIMLKSTVIVLLYTKKTVSSKDQDIKYWLLRPRRLYVLFIFFHFVTTLANLVKTLIQLNIQQTLIFGRFFSTRNWHSFVVLQEWLHIHHQITPLWVSWHWHTQTLTHLQVYCLPVPGSKLLFLKPLQIIT